MNNAKSRMKESHTLVVTDNFVTLAMMMDGAGPLLIHFCAERRTR
jgi:hypothetical protein